MSKLDDSTWSGKITEYSTNFMKKLSRDKVIWMEKIALEFTDSAKGSDL